MHWNWVKSSLTLTTYQKYSVAVCSKWLSHETENTNIGPFHPYRKLHWTAFAKDKTIFIFYHFGHLHSTTFTYPKEISCTQLALHLGREGLSSDLLTEVCSVYHCCESSHSDVQELLFAWKRIFNNLHLKPSSSLLTSKDTAWVWGFMYREKQNSLILSEIKTKTPSLKDWPWAVRLTHTTSWVPGQCTPRGSTLQ